MDLFLWYKYLQKIVTKRTATKDSLLLLIMSLIMRKDKVNNFNKVYINTVKMTFEEIVKIPSSNIKLSAKPTHTCTHGVCNKKEGGLKTDINLTWVRVRENSEEKTVQK